MVNILYDKKRALILSCFLFTGVLTGCASNPPPSSQITAGQSEIKPYGLVAWCKKLSDEDRAREPECK